MSTNTNKNTPVTETLEVKPGYKNTKFGIAPIDWIEKRLTDVCVNFKSGNSITSKDIYENGSYLVYGGNGIRGYTNTFTHDGKYFLIGRQGALCGNIVKVEGKVFISEHAIAVNTNAENDLTYLAYRMEEAKLNRLSESSAQPGLSVNKLTRLKFAFPPLPEQQKIASILSTWDEALANTKTLISQLKNRKKGLMQQLLTGKTRLSGFDCEWDEMKLGDFFTERKETKQVGKQLLSVGKGGVYPQDNSVKKDTSNSDKSKYKKICVGDIGYNTMRMWQGRSALSSLEGIVSPAYTIVTPKSNCNSEYFSYLFKLNEMIHKFYRNSQGMVSDTWMCKFKDFSIVKFMAPSSIEEQKAIAKVLNSADAEIIQQESYLAALQTQKKGLMQQLLTGKTRVKLD